MKKAIVFLVLLLGFISSPVLAADEETRNIDSIKDNTIILSGMNPEMDDGIVTNDPNDPDYIIPGQTLTTPCGSYTVTKGDSIWKISETFLRNGCELTASKSNNGPRIPANTNTPQTNSSFNSGNGYDESTSISSDSLDIDFDSYVEKVVQLETEYNQKIDAFQEYTDEQNAKSSILGDPIIQLGLLTVFALAVVVGRKEYVRVSSSRRTKRL